MKHFPRLHDSYIARSVLIGVLAAWGVLLGLQTVLAFAGEVGDIGKGGYTLSHAIVVTGVSLPSQAYLLFPTAALIGALLGLGQMAASSELTALRALGLSRRRIGASVLLSLSLLTALMVINGETLAPKGDEYARALRTVRYNNMVVSKFSGLWAREGGVFLNAATGEQKQRGDDRWLELRGVRLFEFEHDGRLKSIATAEQAEHRPGGWVLRKVDRVRFGEKSVQQAQVAEERWQSQLDEAALASSVTRPSNMGTMALHDSIEYRKRNGMDAGDFERVYWGRWFYPINVLALCLAAIPFAFGSLRSGGYGKRVFIGIVFALGFWMLQMIVTKLASIYHFDFRVAYAIPPIVMLGVSYLFFHRRSG